MPPDATPERLSDWDWMTAELTGIAPIAELRGRSAYMPLSWGWVIGEVISRADPARRSFTSIVQEDRVNGRILKIGLGGYFLGGEAPPAEPVVGLASTVLCSPGAGGSIAWADFKCGLSVAICHNRMFYNNPPLPAESHPFTALGEAVRALAGSSNH